MFLLDFEQNNTFMGKALDLVSKNESKQIMKYILHLFVPGDKVTDLFCFYHLTGSLQVLEAGKNGRYGGKSRVLLSDFCKVVKRNFIKRILFVS